jgi:hypothetical protein
MTIPNEQVIQALFNLEERGLVTIDEEDISFEPTSKGLENNQWLTELQKLLPGIYIRSN